MQTRASEILDNAERYLRSVGLEPESWHRLATGYKPDQPKHFWPFIRARGPLGGVCWIACCPGPGADSVFVRCRNGKEVLCCMGFEGEQLHGGHFSRFGPSYQHQTFRQRVQLWTKAAWAGKLPARFSKVRNDR